MWVCFICICKEERGKVLSILLSYQNQFFFCTKGNLNLHLCYFFRNFFLREMSYVHCKRRRKKQERVCLLKDCWVVVIFRINFWKFWFWVTFEHFCLCGMTSVKKKRKIWTEIRIGLRREDLQCTVVWRQDTMIARILLKLGWGCDTRICIVLWRVLSKWLFC